MSVQVVKTGIVNASGEIGANLLKGSNIVLTQTTDGWSSMDYTIPDISMLATGTQLVVSVDIELYNVESMYRIGCEPSFTRSGATDYVGVWTSNPADRKEHIFSVRTLSGTPEGVGQRGIYIQNVVFKSGGGYIKVSNPKLEIGSAPTVWCPNVNDDEYVGNTSGFNESTDIASITKGYITAPDFLEI